MKTAIIVDSTATLPQKLSALPNVFQINLNVIYADGRILEDTADEQVILDYYKELSTLATLPTTSQPTNGEIYSVYEDIIAAGYDQVFGITIAGKLSGTLSSLQAIAEEFSDRITSYIIDAKSTSMVSAHLVKECLRLLEADHDADFIVSALNEAANQARTFVIVGSLDNLVKGGRLSATGAFLGNLMRITPLIEIDESGALKVIDKIRTEKKMKERFKAFYEAEYAKYGDRLHVAIAHGNAKDRALSIVANMNDEMDIDSVPVSTLTPVVGTHVGEGCIGIFTLVDIDA